MKGYQFKMPISFCKRIRCRCLHVAETGLKKGQELCLSGNAHLWTDHLVDRAGVNGIAVGRIVGCRSPALPKPAARKIVWVPA